MLMEFEKKVFRRSSKIIIDQANRIIDKYTSQGYELTLRQLYYQFVKDGSIDNVQSEYKRLGSIINDARLAGLISWTAIVDRTRRLDKPPHWASPEEIVEVIVEQYREDLWAEQPYYVEVWVEKEALVGVIERACEEIRVPFFACRGYVSQSEQWRAGRRLLGKRRLGKRLLVLHLGDHDPSGTDMTRDNEERLSMFAGLNINVERIALNMDQIEEYNPPPNPAKEKDARFAKYYENYGEDSWELDALDPSVLHNLIESSVLDIRREAAWKISLDRETANRAILRSISDNLGAVKDFVREKFPPKKPEDDEPEDGALNDEL